MTDIGDERVRIKLDIKTGELEVDSSAAQFTEVVKQISDLIPSLRQAQKATQATTGTGETNIEERADVEGPRRRTRASKAPNGNNRGALGATRYQDFQPIKLGISDQAEIELQEFYKLKQPKGQEEQVATIILKLASLLGRDRLNYDQIYQGFRVVAEAYPPKSLAGVVSNMATKMLIEREADGIRLKIQGVDLVEKELPRKTSKP